MCLVKLFLTGSTRGVGVIICGSSKTALALFLLKKQLFYVECLIGSPGGARARAGEGSSPKALALVIYKMSRQILVRWVVTSDARLRVQNYC